MEYFDLGTYTRKVTTSSDEAQLWFNRGLAWTYAYNHEEAIVCFQKAVTADPGCAMAHWGIAKGGVTRAAARDIAEEAIEEEKPGTIDRLRSMFSKDAAGE